MSFTIRPYSKTDFAMLDQWWRTSGELGPLETMIPPESTWVLEIDKRPALSVSVIRTNVREYCYVENFIGNPELKGPLRKEATLSLLQYIQNYARERGYRRMLCLAHRGPLKARYQEIGFTQTLDNVASFSKEII
jgi:hypothetical protein